MLFTDTIKAIEPPNETTLAKYRNIEIKSNVDNKNTTIETIEYNLKNSKVGNKSYFNSVSFYEKSKKIDKSYAIFSVEIEKPKIEQFAIKEYRIKCPGSGLIRTCDSSQGVKYTVDCTKTIATVFGKYSILDSKGKRITVRRFNSSKQDTACEDYMSTPESAKHLAYKASIDAGNEITNNFIPKVVDRPNDLIKKDTNLSSNNQKKMEEAFNIASEKSISLAKKSYEDLYKKLPNNNILTYNIAYCEYMLGNYSTAASLFEKYLSKASEPNSDAKKYLDEANVWISKGIHNVITRT
ncbi:hypothetical protein JHD45_20335 [Marinomonas spartinae]|nr:hypothetical protein [Marinomonas spartinae]